MYIEPMPYLSNVGKIDALSKESETPCPVGEAAATSSDSGGLSPQQRKLSKKQLLTHKITNEQNNYAEEVNHCNLSTEDFLKLLSC
jgi:hypothetical protein